MNLSRNFIVIASLYIILGVAIGIYMGASNNHDLAPLHAHINLLGFVLPMVFGLTYAVFPAVGDNGLARAHFWLHEVGTFVLLIMLALLLTGRIGEEAMVPIAPIAELLVLLGLVTFAVNVFRKLG